MLVRLARNPKSIAWFFISLIYVELVLTPVLAKGNIPYPVFSAAYRGYVNKPLAKPAVAGTAFREQPAAPENLATGNKVPSISPVSIKTPEVATAPESGGPTQPEMQAFSSVNGANMVDLFSGDFSYTIPLLDVGGYPVTLGYKAGSSMDDEASWVGLGWNVNPGAITRNLRGLPDDFNGDTVKKVMNIKPNRTTGVSLGSGIEVTGGDLVGSKVGMSLGVVYNNYRGWGVETKLSASVSAGLPGLGDLTSGLSIGNSTMDGVTITPNLTLSRSISSTDNNITRSSIPGLTLSSSYNSRGGIRALQMSIGFSQQKSVGKNKNDAGGAVGNSLISFYSPTAMPGIKIPYTSSQFTFSAKMGKAVKVIFPNFTVSGYQSVQMIAPEDTLMQLSSYGYLHYQDGGNNLSALLDISREKELPYAEKPAYPHIGVPSYTYDAFSITGEGTGGMFRGYRNDIGYVYDHLMRTRDGSGNLGLDLGAGDLSHLGFDLNFTRSNTSSYAWLGDNPIIRHTRFRNDSGFYQAAYFRNPGEKSINSKKFYKDMGGDQVVTMGLSQNSPNSPSILGTNNLIGYANQRIKDTNRLTEQNTIKPERDKRSQVITYMTAREAESGALSKYIENYTPNAFEPAICGNAFTNVESRGYGLLRFIYNNKEMKGDPVHVSQAPQLVYLTHSEWRPYALPEVNEENFAIRWVGRIKAPVTGKYKFYVTSDDGAAIKLNDKWIFDKRGTFNFSGGERFDSANLVKDEFYDIEVIMTQFSERSGLILKWEAPGLAKSEIDAAFLYTPAIDTFAFKQTRKPSDDLLVKEKRVNSFRKPDHISELSVLNADGRRYVYGIPVYNFIQKDISFAVDGVAGGNSSSGLVKYLRNEDNTSKNMKGSDRYYSKEVMPAYAHSFLLTGILSADYSDITGNGITDDDLGDAIKFNYSRVNDKNKPFRWRSPSVSGDSASFNEGLLTDYRDDKGSYVYGEKEMWFLHSIESKTMIATFVVESRTDLVARDENGTIDPSGYAKRLKEINLYNKADFAIPGANPKPIKTVHFEYSYELCKGVNQSASGKLTLKKVSFTYNGVKKGTGKGQNPYMFSYHSNNPNYNLKSYDRWGNYKNNLDNPGATTVNPITNIEYPYALQDSALAAKNAGAWNLDSISLPSGGAIKVDYEGDDYGYVQNRRAMQLFKIVGLGGNPAVLPQNSGKLYEKNLPDNDIVFIKVPRAVTSAQDVFNYYLKGVNKLYFRLSVEMPNDNYSNGKKFEYIPCYAELDPGKGYGLYNSNTIWVKLKGISLKGDGDGVYSPLVKAATQFIRLNLPSKAFPGSETGDAIDLAEAAQAVKMIVGWVPLVLKAFDSFDATARAKGYGMFIDTSRSFVRLNNPWLKKYGGGHRVKRITIYDNWDKMTNQRPAKYGQEYTYSTVQEVDGRNTTISSGVAIYEPSIGAEENPFRQPIEYVEKSSVLGPVTLGYSEEPLGESFFPAAGVGYSCVRTRTINYKNKKSANGLSETRFYTAYDFPVYTERTMLDVDNKKRFKSPLGNYFKINARHYLALSQGFKIELNDMHGKVRSEATIAETELKTGNYISRTEYYYKTKTGSDGNLRLDNTVTAINPQGQIDTTAVIGKDLELMMDMREQRSDVSSRNIGLNTDMFAVGVGLWIIPAAIPMFQDEKTVFRSAATTKLIQRYGIIDKVTVTDRGSSITTENMLYDSETGDVLMTKTRNEFNDPVYHFTYPSHWAYDGMGLAYKNVDVRLDHLNFRDGKIQGATAATNRFFTSGDEILVFGKQKTGGADCNEEIATFPNGNKVWCLDSSVITGGISALYFIDRSGRPYNGLDVSIRILRSGRRNIMASVGEFTSLKNPIVKNITSGEYELKVDKNAKILAASSNQFRQFWKVEDAFAKKKNIDCLPHYSATGRLRCVQENGVNTGIQEMEEIDINIYSGAYGQSRWISLGFNCKNCPLKESWFASGITRCQVDSLGRYTGYMEREEVDTLSCGQANARSRWTRYELNCAQCPQSPEMGRQKDTLMKYLSEFEQSRQTSYGVRTSYKTADNIIFDYLPEIAENGVLALPLAERNKPGNEFSSIKAELSNSNFCWQNGYAIEARMKFSGMPAKGDVVKLNAMNLTATYARTDSTLVLKKVTDNYGLNRVFANVPGDSLYGFKDTSRLKEWFTVKVIVLPTHYYVYLDSRLFWDTARNSANAITSFNNFGFDLAGRKGVMDWVKVYNADGQLKYFEDYTKPQSPAMPEKSFYCPTAAPDCKTAFVNYYNQRAGKNYTFKQIDSVYYLYTCRNVDVCGSKETVVNIVKRFNSISNPYRLTIAAQTSQFLPDNPNWKVSDPALIVKDGYLTFTDTLRTIPAAINPINYLHIVGNAPYCTDGGYSYEWKIKHLRNDLNGLPAVGYVQDENLKISFTSSTEGYFISKLEVQNGTPILTDITIPRFFVSTDRLVNYREWVTYKLKVTPDSVIFYCNATRAFGVLRQSPIALKKLKTITFAHKGHQAAIDWFKLYDSNNELKISEDFNDPTTIARVPLSFYCPAPGGNCQTLFVNYFNQQNGSAMTYAQIAALYLALTGQVLNVCD